MAPEPTHYQLAIVGGGISGLTLALICERLNVSYVLLEAHEAVVARGGTGIGLQPNGLRILDQLGLLEDIEAATIPLARWYSYDSNGELISDSTAVGTLTEKIGYPITFIERAELLRIMSSHLQCTDSIKVLSRVSSITESKDSVKIDVQNGKYYTADLVIGADGVHSVVRDFIEASSPPPSPSEHAPKPDMSVSFAAVYGLSTPIDGVANGERFAVYREKETIIGFPGKNGMVFWLIFEQLKKTHPLCTAPRYTIEDAKALCERVSHVRVLPNSTFGDLYANQKVAVKIAVEEGTARNWYTNRAVLVGDAVCKTTPAGGQGANQAIESCAELMNGIMDLLNSYSNDSDANGRLNSEALKSTLIKYHQTRAKPATIAVERSRLIAESLLCFPGESTNRMIKAMTTTSDEEWLSMIRAGFADAPSVKNIPLSPRGHKFAQATSRRPVVSA